MEQQTIAPERSDRQAEPRFTVVTKMEIKDLRPFLYTATFLGNPITLPLIVAICGIGAAVISRGKGVATLLSLWVVYLILTVAFISWQVEWRNRKQVKNTTGEKIAPDQEMRFYENDLVIDQWEQGAHSEVGYDQIHQILERKRYLIVFYTKTMVTLIRKEDMDGETARQLPLFLKEKLGQRMRRL